MGLLEYCRALPKVELHAHLNGSLSDATVLKLLNAREKKKDDDFTSATAEVTIRKGHQRTLEECFQVFSILHSLTDNMEAVRTITLDVIEEFAHDNVRYLELRTTPKDIPSKMTKKDYLNAVLQAILDAMERCSIKVRLLLSIDRARGLKDAWSTLHLAKEYSAHNVFGPLIIGLDVSGNPRSGNLMDYLTILEEAQRCGLKTSVHLAEVPNEAETNAVLSHGLANRIGHGTFIHPATGGSSQLHQLVTEQNIPFELCISSNIKSGTVKKVTDHHLGVWKSENHPIVICTDDKGVFSTSLSEEFVLCTQTFSLTEKDLHNLCLSGVDASFLPEDEKQKLREDIKEELNFLEGKLKLY